MEDCNKMRCDCGKPVEFEREPYIGKSVWEGFWDFFPVGKLCARILETMFYRDMVKRFAFRDVKEFQEAFYYILSLYGGHFTYRSLQRALKGLGVEANVKTVMNYLRAMEESFLVFQLPIFSPSTREFMIKPRKSC